MKALTRMGAVELAQLIATGQSSSQEVVEAHIARIQEVNPALNAVVAPCFDAARQQARAADALQRAGAPLPPLHGVPVTVKECLDLAGHASTFGLQNRAQHRATVDEPHVARLRAAGGIVLCKTNVAQALMYYESDNPLFGRSNNPWNVARSPGGSSGGEAALIASGASPLGLGTDIGGSVRIPAAFCGITSLKPTSGRCDDLGRFSVPLGQRAVPSQVGALARNVQDVALALEVINGGPQPEVLPPRPLADWRSVDVRQLRIGLYTDDGTFDTAPGVARAVRQAADMLRAAGAQVVPWSPPDATRAMNLLYGIFGADSLTQIVKSIGPGKKAPQISQMATLASMPRPAVTGLMTLLRLVGQRGMADGLTAFGFDRTAHYWELVEDQLDYQSEFARAMDNANGGPLDAILCPPCALPAFTHGASKDLITAGAYACLYNLLGYPAGVVPVGRVQASEESVRSPSKDRIQSVAMGVERGSAGLPVGVQVVARPWREHIALAAMASVELAARKLADYPLHPPI